MNELGRGTKNLATTAYPRFYSIPFSHSLTLCDNEERYLFESRQG